MNSKFQPSYYKNNLLLAKYAVAPIHDVDVFFYFQNLDYIDEFSKYQ